jgi:NhaC family Na+:H+ antiporter
MILISLLALNVYFFGDDTLSGSNQTALLIATAVAVIISSRKGNSWKKILESIVDNVKFTIPSIILLLMIGALAGTWLLSGIIPAMIYYGLKLINPDYFLVTCAIISALVSLGTGSSWSTIATIGLAFIAIGRAMDFNEALVAGAIISGAYFGDKLSPMSDTTNLASAIAGTDLFTHIRYMMQTTIPSMLVSLVIFFFLGISNENSLDAESIQVITSELDSVFYISPILFIVPLLVIVMIVKKVPAIPTIFIGVFLGAILAIIFQSDILVSVSGIFDNYWEASYISCSKAIYGETVISCENEFLKSLLNSSGTAGMLNTIWLILTAMFFSGAMASAKMLETISESIVKYATTQSSLVGSTIASCIFLNGTTSDQYLSIVVSGQMYKSGYKERGLKPEVLSRTLEDSATVTSVLVPWNTCGATQAAVLGVSTLAYAPFCFFCIISPIMSFLLAFFNIGIRKLKKLD